MSLVISSPQRGQGTSRNSWSAHCLQAKCPLALWTTATREGPLQKEQAVCDETRDLFRVGPCWGAEVTLKVVEGADPVSFEGGA